MTILKEKSCFCAYIYPPVYCSFQFSFVNTECKISAGSWPKLTLVQSLESIRQPLHQNPSVWQHMEVSSHHLNPSTSLEQVRNPASILVLKI